VQRRLEFHRNSRENGHGGIIDTPLEPPDYIGMDTRIERKRFLRQVAPFPTFPNLLTETPQY
jgi:hypothetical protein